MTTIRRRNFFALLHPVRVRADSLRPMATFGLGVAGIALLGICAASGALLLFHYVPSTDPETGAYASMQDLRHAVPYGDLVRAVHRWSAHLLVVAMFFHMCRVFYRGAFKGPRRLNWVIGVLLLLVILVTSYTGYLLPWDQLSYWAVEVGTRLLAAVPAIGGHLRRMLLGGDEIGQTALVRFYALHVAILPATIIFLLGVHLWRIRQDGGLAHRSENPGSTASPEPMLPAWPHLVWRELAVLVGCVLVVLVLALLWRAPLGEPADPAHAPESVKAAWYFVWLQEIVSYDFGPLARIHWPPWDSDGPVLGNEFWGGVVLPLAGVALLVLIPYLSRRRDGIGVYCARGRRWTCSIFTAAMLAVIVLIVIGAVFRGPEWKLVWPF